MFVASYPDRLKHTEYHDTRLDGGVHTVPDFQTTPKNQEDWNLKQDFQRLLLALKQSDGHSSAMQIEPSGELT